MMDSNNRRMFLRSEDQLYDLYRFLIALHIISDEYMKSDGPASIDDDNKWIKKQIDRMARELRERCI